MPATRRAPRRLDSAAPSSVHVLKVTLREVSTPVWRRIEVPSDVTLARLHRILQGAMGWEESHLHEFVTGDDHFGEPDPDFGPEVRSDRGVRLDQVAPAPGSTFTYLYDFGDGWEHAIVVESVRPPEAGATYPRCLAGERACPPEDCGGPHGYFELLEALADPTHEEHDHMRQWIGGTFAPDAFDRSAADARLRRVR